MSTDTLMTSADRYAADIADARRAHQIEDQARAAIRATEGGAELLDHIAATLRSRLGHEAPTTPRAVEATVVREAAKDLPAGRATDRVRALLAAADDCYWAMVLRHDRIIRRDASKLARGNEWDDVYMNVRIGWYRAAMRWDLDRGLKFSTLAPHWGRREANAARDFGAMTDYDPRGKHRRGVPVASLGDTVRRDRGHVPDDLTLADTIADPNCTPEAIDAALDEPRERARLAAAIDRLPTEQARTIMRRRVAGVVQKDIADADGLTKQRVSQVEICAVRELRQFLAAG